MKKTLKQKGFTLIELAIVLVIIGLLLGMGAKLVGILTKRAKYNDAKEIVNSAVESIINFAILNKRLPTLTEFKNVVPRPQDSWNKDLIYFVDATLTNTPNLCGIRRTNLIIFLCHDSSCANRETISNVAFMVASGGLNFNVQTGNVTTGCPAGYQCIGVYDYGIEKVDNYPSDINRPEKYDDITKWVTLNELLTKMECSEGEGGRLTILNQMLPFGYVGVNYNVTIFASGGIPYENNEYEWCVEGNLPPGLTLSPDVKRDNCMDSLGFWEKAKNLDLSGVPTQSGTYQIKVFVKDNSDPSGENDTIVSKEFVITVNPSPTGLTSGFIPQGSQVSFFQNLGDFILTGNPKGLTVDSSTGSIYLGNYNYHTASCFWYPSSYNFNQVFRAYFEFKTLYVDSSPDSRDYADGFTFALINAGSSTNVCGVGGGGLGFSGLPDETKPNLAIEFDFWPNRNLKDPAGDHIGIDKDSSVYHIDPNSYYKNNNPNFLEDGMWHRVRIEGHRNGNIVNIKVWFDCENCDDLTKDFSGEEPVLDYNITNYFNINAVKFGFTQATGGATQKVEIKNFGIRFE